MKTRIYTDNFLKGIGLAGTIDPVFVKDGSQVESFKRYITDAVSGRNDDVYAQVRPVLTTLAHRFVAAHDPRQELGRRCHVFSDHFNRQWRNVPNNPIWLLLTIGEVKYKGDSVYDISEFDVIRTVKRGFRPDEPLNVHAWLTLEDMTIIDLTLMASLLRLNRFTEPEYRKMPVVIGKPDELADFEYTPFLVDNDFVARVDRGSG
jgi:hypothetical protein